MLVHPMTFLCHPAEIPAAPVRNVAGQRVDTNFSEERLAHAIQGSI